MATFGSWLTEQKHRSDVVGELSRRWVAAEGDRPKVHSPSGIDRWFGKQANYEQTHGWMEAAVREYQAAPRSLQAVPDGQQVLPFGPQMTPVSSISPGSSVHPGQIQLGGGQGALHIGQGAQSVADWSVEIRNRLAAVEGKLDAIIGALGIELPEPVAAQHLAEVPTGDHPEPQPIRVYGWPQLAAMADYTDEAQ